jgi:outer membrane immunogenic protein
MRRLFVASGLAIAALTTSAVAADYSPSPVLRGALPGTDKGTDWSGFYAGGSGSYATINTASTGTGGAVDPTLERLVKGTYVASGISTMPLVEQGKPQNSRMGFGLYAGYNWAFDEYVFGLEADYTRGKLEGGSTGVRSGAVNYAVGPLSYIEDWNANTEKGYKITDYGSVRTRLGYAWDNWMPYMTVGLAYARASVSNSASISSSIERRTQFGGFVSRSPGVFTPSFMQESNRSKFFFGYALGAGLDVAVTSNIILRAEFQHLRFTEVSGSGLQLNQAKLGAALKF